MTSVALPPQALAAYPLTCSACGRPHESPRPAATCAECLGPLEVVYPAERVLPDREEIAGRPHTLWRYADWLPFEGAPVAARQVGWTPLLDAPRVAQVLGVRRAWLKVDALSSVSLSFKDRVVATALNAVRAFGLEAIACASTGNLANAVATAAAREGIPAWIFVPEELEQAKLIATLVHGPRLVRVRGTYDDVNRLCAQLADEFAWGIANVNLRAYYGEGSKTMAFEIAEQLGWRLPTAVIAPMAGGSLVTKLHKGFGEFLAAGLVAGTPPRLYGAQASGCAPIVRAFARGDGAIVPERPATIARSLAIGNPADGRAATQVLRNSGGDAAHVEDDLIRAGIRELASLTGVFGETAAGVTYAATKALAARGAFIPEDEVVLCITGHGLKTAESLAADLSTVPVIAPRVRDVAALI
ncbi:MAG: threonine synthase [Gemmatimonadetes bacterium]|nr:threonine synthase [Gemmatimonadota bacterium]